MRSCGLRPSSVSDGQGKAVPHGALSCDSIILLLVFQFSCGASPVSGNVMLTLPLPKIQGRKIHRDPSLSHETITGGQFSDLEHGKVCYTEGPLP